MYILLRFEECIGAVVKARSEFEVESDVLGERERAIKKR